jgi:hypothetical protein
MEDSLDQRKEKFIANLKTEYSNKPRPWWKSSYTEYVATETIANTPPYLKVHDAKSSFKRNKAIDLFGLVGSILLIFISCFVEFFWIWMGLIGLFIAIKSTIELLDRDDKLRVSTEGIWDKKSNKNILWPNIMLTCIKEFDSDESTIRHLLVHYYNKETDSFQCNKISLDNLDSDFKVIAFSIEYFKMLACQR